MLNNFNTYGQTIYYQEILTDDCEDLRLATFCKDRHIKMGLVYSFTLEMKPATLGVYALSGNSKYL